MTRRVAILGTRGYPSYYGGFETLLRTLVPYLAEKGWEVDVYGRRGATSSDQLPDGVRSVVLPGLDLKSTSTLSYGFTAALHAAFSKYDAVLVMNVANGYWLPILKVAKTRTIVNVDGIEWKRDKWGKFAKAVFQRGANLTAKYADYLVADAEEIARVWDEEYSRTSTFIPYGGHGMVSAAVAQSRIAELLLVPREYILFVARFVPENTIQEFLQAARKLSETSDVVIVGSSGYGGPWDEAASKLAADRPRVKWLGHLRDDELLFALWQNAGVYFHGHSVGGTNPALVQAMACGAPTIARDTVYNREVLADSGRFVEPTSEAIVDATSSLLLDSVEQSRMSNASVARQNDLYTWDGVCQRYESLLLEALQPATKVAK